MFFPFAEVQGWTRVPERVLVDDQQVAAQKHCNTVAYTGTPIETHLRCICTSTQTQGYPYKVEDVMTTMGAANCVERMMADRSKAMTLQGSVKRRGFHPQAAPVVTWRGCDHRWQGIYWHKHRKTILIARNPSQTSWFMEFIDPDAKAGEAVVVPAVVSFYGCWLKDLKNGSLVVLHIKWALPRHLFEGAINYLCPLFWCLRSESPDADIW